ncbi:hypothetical protein GCM10020221_03600 [Streptomyces thioluteus]|uniref:Uncharacterized protein n=1 Tax=Streptomyces thioluteus TaxID=66431 RepID=A0ABP6IVG0_STRTU
MLRAGGRPSALRVVGGGAAPTPRRGLRPLHPRLRGSAPGPPFGAPPRTPQPRSARLSSSAGQAEMARPDLKSSPGRTMQPALQIRRGRALQPVWGLPPVRGV